MFDCELWALQSLLPYTCTSEHTRSTHSDENQCWWRANFKQIQTSRDYIYLRLDHNYKCGSICILTFKLTLAWDSIFRIMYLANDSSHLYIILSLPLSFSISPSLFHRQNSNKILRLQHNPHVRQYSGIWDFQLKITYFAQFGIEDRMENKVAKLIEPTTNSWTDVDRT